MESRLRILLVCDNASARYGGEAILPLHYFRTFRSRGDAVWLVTHARNRAELAALFPGEARIRYVEDTWLHRAMWRLGRRLPDAVADATTSFVSRLAVQIAQRGMVRRLVAAEAIDIVHQPTPVSPREPSLIFGVGVPVVIGPMNGGMDYPPAFRLERGTVERLVRRLGWASAHWVNALLPGKRHAALLLVANERSRRALPRGVSDQVIRLVENGVDLALWAPRPPPPASQVCTFAFMGRLVALKAVDLLVEAFAAARARAPMRLVVMGDGDERAELERMVQRLVPADALGQPAVRFTGWLDQAACASELERVDCLVMPSLHDCGGSVVLEAMAMAKPVIATAWGGPLDYLDSACGILVEPSGRAALVAGLAAAMVRLAGAPAERAAMGHAARAKIERHYDWEMKAEHMLALYRRTLAPNGPCASS